MADDNYLEPYRKSQRRHGSGFAVTLWASERSQQRRFEVLAHMIHLAGKRVLDAGCSRGDFAQFLREHGVHPARYVGIDALEELVTFARSREIPHCEFYCGNFVEDPSVLTMGKPEVICLSGALNTMNDAQVLATLEACWAAAGEALIFNFLSDRAATEAPYQHGPVRRLDTVALLDWALERTSQVSFRQDYFRHGHDATILMKKE